MKFLTNNEKICVLLLCAKDKLQIGKSVFALRNKTNILRNVTYNMRYKTHLLRKVILTVLKNIFRLRIKHELLPKLPKSRSQTHFYIAH